jgi:hypothetical protein
MILPPGHMLGVYCTEADTIFLYIIKLISSGKNARGGVKIFNNRILILYCITSVSTQFTENNKDFREELVVGDYFYFSHFFKVE